MKPDFSLNRRVFLMSSASVVGGGMLARPAWARRELFPVVETSNGKLMGARSGGIHSFMGIRYGAPTSGTNRFMPPQPVEKWAGVKEALAFSDAAPQMPGNRSFDYGDLIVFDRHPSGLGEDCLALNLWTSLAATGDPNNDRLPDWPVYTQDARATMIFDVDTRVENDPRADIRAFWEGIDA